MANNNAPVFTATDFTFDFTGPILDGTTRGGSVTDTDGPQNFVTFTISGKPAFLNFADNGDNTWSVTNPTAITGGVYPMTISAFDGINTVTHLWTATYNQKPYVGTAITNIVDATNFKTFH